MWSISTQWQVLQEGTQGKNRPSRLECPALAEIRRFGGLCALWMSQRRCDDRVKWLREETGTYIHTGELSGKLRS